MTKEHPEGTYICIPKTLFVEFLDGGLTEREAFALCFLFYKANHINGYARISYPGLAEELRYSTKDCVSTATKVVRNLSRAGHIEFEKHQGKKGTFKVKVKEYYTPERLRAVKENYKRLKNRSSAEVLEAEQKFDSDLGVHSKAFSQSSTLSGRSFNNDNKNKSNKDLSPLWKCKLTSDELKRCEEIAKGLDEESPAFVISVCKKHGLHIVEELYDRVLRRSERLHIESLGAFFNNLVKDYEETGILN